MHSALTPEQAIEQARVGAQLCSKHLCRLRPAFVELIEYGQFGAGREYLAAPAAKYEIHHMIRCGVHRPSPLLRPALLAARLETMLMEAGAGQSKDCEFGSQNCILHP